jgi:hypothetical protein
MSEAGADLSQIRGDWKFHMDYLTNAINHTMDRQMKLWTKLPDQWRDPQVEQAINAQKSLWDTLNADANSAGTIPTADPECVEFIAACRDGKAACDALEERDDKFAVEDFAEACRQTRALCDDLEMMREQRPDDI